MYKSRKKRQNVPQVLLAQTQYLKIKLCLKTFVNVQRYSSLFLLLLLGTADSYIIFSNVLRSIHNSLTNNQIVYFKHLILVFLLVI